MKIDEFFEKYEESDLIIEQRESRAMGPFVFEKDNLLSNLLFGESVIRHFKNEHALIFFENLGKGYVVEGYQDSVDASVVGDLNGAILTHNHTYNSNGSVAFSVGDIIAAKNYKLKEIRVVQQNGKLDILNVSQCEEISPWTALAVCSGNWPEDFSIKSIMSNYRKTLIDNEMQKLNFVQGECDRQL